MATSMDFIANSMNRTTEDQIIKDFKKIKGNKFNNATVRQTFETLKALNLISA